MPTQTTTFRCLLISPGDVAEERQAIVEAVERWNTTTGINLNAHVIATRWEFARPEMGAPPQDVINAQLVDEADFGIAIFWAKVGTATAKHPSGSVEEVERLLAKGANVMVYFSGKDVPQDLLRDDQYDKLIVVRKEYEKRGLLASFKTTDKLVEMVSLHLTSLVSGLLTKERAGNQPIPSTGVLTAPKPDIRVLVASGLVGHDEMEPMLVVEIQNHSPVSFFFGGLFLSLKSGSKMFITRDAIYGIPLTSEKIEPGSKKTIGIDVDELMKGITEPVANLHVKDSIDRLFVADYQSTIAAIEEAKRMRKKYPAKRKRRWA
jgi:hypothetical protein